MQGAWIIEGLDNPSLENWGRTINALFVPLKLFKFWNELFKVLYRELSLLSCGCYYSNYDLIVLSNLSCFFFVFHSTTIMKYLICHCIYCHLHKKFDRFIVNDFFLQVGLAEEYHKPILTIKLQQASEIDPGLKLVLYRRQVICYMWTLKWYFIKGEGYKHPSLFQTYVFKCTICAAYFWVCFYASKVYYCHSLSLLKLNSSPTLKASIFSWTYVWRGPSLKLFFNDLSILTRQNWIHQLFHIEETIQCNFHQYPVTQEFNTS